MRADGDMNMCEQGVLRGEAGGGVARLLGPITGWHGRVRGCDQHRQALDDEAR